MQRIPTARIRSSKRRAKATARTSGRGRIAGARAIPGSGEPDGARNVDRRGAAWPALVALAVLASAGCLSESEQPPSHLVDGTRARVPAVRLDAPNPQIITSVEA